MPRFYAQLNGDNEFGEDGVASTGDLMEVAQWRRATASVAILIWSGRGWMSGLLANELWLLVFGACHGSELFVLVLISCVGIKTQLAVLARCFWACVAAA